VPKLVLTLLITIILSACNLGKDYMRPELDFLPSGFKYATPSNIEFKDNWWHIFADENLDHLISKLLNDNLSLAIAEARFNNAEALVNATYASFWPSFDLGANARRSNSVNTKKVEISSSWQLDLWGKVRRQLEGDRANLQANLNDLAAAKLSLSSEITHHYLQIAMLDAQIRLLKDAVNAYAATQKITINKYQAGIAPKSDVTQALTQLKNAELQVVSMEYQRVQHENAIAVLIGEPPTNFTLTEIKNLPLAPQLPQHIPSDLLERRPDIASAEQKIIAANAAIGVAKAAYFPSFSFSASGGYASSHLTNLLSSDNQSWAFGPSVNLGLFDFGFKKAQVAKAQANLTQMVSSYKQTVLIAVREVEDALAALNFLTQQSVIQAEALAASKESLRLIHNQYQAGKVDYQSVVNLQTSALSHERSLITLQTNILRANVQLITALGGGFKIDN